MLRYVWCGLVSCGLLYSMQEAEPKKMGLRDFGNRITHITIAYHLGTLNITNQAHPQNPKGIVLEYVKKGASFQLIEDTEGTKLDLKIRASEPVEMQLYKAGLPVEIFTNGRKFEGMSQQMLTFEEN